MPPYHIDATAQHLYPCVHRPTWVIWRCHGGTWTVVGASDSRAEAEGIRRDRGGPHGRIEPIGIIPSTQPY